MNNGENDTMVMVLGTVLPGVEPVPGSVVIIAGCGHYAWMSPRAAEVLSRNDHAETQCITCMPADLLGEQAAALPGALEDAARHLGVSVEAVKSDFADFVAKHGARLATETPKGIDL